MTTRVRSSIFNMFNDLADLYPILIVAPVTSRSEPPHDRTNKVAVRPAKTQISLGAQWVAKDPMFPHADSEDSDQTVWMPRLI